MYQQSSSAERCLEQPICLHLGIRISIRRQRAAEGLGSSVAPRGRPPSGASNASSARCQRISPSHLLPEQRLLYQISIFTDADQLGGPGWLPAREFWEIHFKVCFSRLINLQAPVSLLGAVSTADEPQPGRETLFRLN